MTKLAAIKRKKLAVLNLMINLTKINLRKLNQAFNEMRPEPEAQDS